jgi:hypothetical protein
MQDAMKASVRIAGLLLMAIFVAHCGDSSVHINTTGNGVSPTAGSFSGFTDLGEPIALQVGSIEAIAFECDGTPIAETFSPPAPVNADGSFNVSFTDAGRHFHVSGQFTSNNDVNGTIDDENNACDTGFQASRGTVTIPTRTPAPGVTHTPGGPTQTPGAGETETPSGGATFTPGGGGGPTFTPGGGETTPTLTPGGPTPTFTPGGGGGASCPTLITFTGTSTGGVLDTGWTGLGHDATTITDGTVSVTVAASGGCAGTAPNCGVCTYAGPIENATGLIQIHRCQGDSAITCTSDGDCGGNAPCKFFFGSYLPLAAGGVSTCVGNVFAAGISGTADVNAGTSTGAASLTSRVFNGATVSNPCPNCIGDAHANDGVKGGTCSFGQHTGAACDASGSSPNISFGTTSLDCPPATGALIASLPINLANTTGNKTRTLSSANPPCSGSAGSLCQCDTCNDSAAEPCATNADCTGSGHICGGKRCVSGANKGASCTLVSECPGSNCGVPGQQTKPNACAAVTDCAANPGTPSPNDRDCPNGPFDSFCSPIETFRGCSVSSDCPFAGDTCTGGKFRDCFDTGVSGVVVTASGQAAPPTNHQSDPTLAAMFCIGPTTSTAVNAAAGLPGLGRLELQGHSIDNGTP